MTENDKNLHVSFIQANLKWENSEFNRKQFEDKIHKIPTETDLVILPEMFTTGFTMNATKIAEKMNGKTIAWMLRLALEKQIAITGSLIISENNNFYNRLIFVHPSGKIDFYDKRHTFTLAKEHKTFSSGNKQLFVDYKGWKIHPLICYDLRFPVWSRNTKDYDLLIYVANWPTKRIYAWDNLLKARAIENMTYTIGVNRVGKDANNFDYNGHSIAIDYFGKPISSEKNEEEEIISLEINKSSQNNIRKQFSFLDDKDSFELNY